MEINKLDLENQWYDEESLLEACTSVQKVYAKLGDKDYYYKHLGDAEKYYDSVKSAFSSPFYSKLISSPHDYILYSFNKIFSKSDFYMLNVTAIEINNEENIEINAELLDIKLNCENIKIIMNNSLKIDDIKSINEKTVKKSSTPINLDSLADSNQNFEKDLERILKILSNKYVYENYEENPDEKMELQLKILLEKTELDTKVMKEIFLIGQGTFENYGIVSCTVSGNTNIYGVSFERNGEIKSFDFTYDRTLEKITKVSV